MFLIFLCIGSSFVGFCLITHEVNPTSDTREFLATMDAIKETENLRKLPKLNTLSNDTS